MNRLYKTIGLLLVSVFFFQCQKDVSYVGGPDTGVAVVITPDPITATLQGNIVDETGLPAAGVTITAETKTTMTDATGYFRIADASLDKNTSLVVAEKVGYFKSYRVFSATSGTNQVGIKLIKRTLAATVTASAGGTATLSNGAKITLPANGVVIASSSSVYTGDVKIFASYIDPEASDIAETVPGSFMANDKDGNRVALGSYGMLAVELESAAGEKLQIKSGAAATLTTPIPATTASAAPATIALWYIDEQTGLWKEEGTATKQGSNYVGDVKHFSYWNCDLRYDAVTLTATFKNANGLPLVNVPVKITIANINGSAHGYTDSLGQIKGLVPKNKNLILQVLDPCGNAVYTQNLAPLTQNTDLGVITVTSATTALLTFQGTLLDCSGAVVKNGYAIINYSNHLRYAATNATGQFSTTFITCAGSTATAHVTGVDLTAQQQGTAATVSVTTPVTNAGNITACGVSSAQFINYTLDGTNYSITSAANDSLMIYSTSQGTTKITVISGMKKFPGTDNISFSVNNVTAAGTYPLQHLSLKSYTNTTLTQPFNVTFSSYPAAGGQFYEGSFSGRFTDSSSAAVVHNISSTFRIRRS